MRERKADAGINREWKRGIETDMMQKHFRNAPGWIDDRWMGRRIVGWIEKWIFTLMMDGWMDKRMDG